MVEGRGEGVLTGRRGGSEEVEEVEDDAASVIGTGWVRGGRGAVVCREREKRRDVRAASSKHFLSGETASLRTACPTTNVTLTSWNGWSGRHGWPNERAT
jgi:hypothetical protein